MGLFSQDALDQLGLLGQGLLLGQSPNSLTNFGTALQYAQQMQRQKMMDAQNNALRESQIEENKAQAEMRKAALLAQEKRQKAWDELVAQRPELAQVAQLAPDRAIDRAFPEPVKPKMSFAPNGQAVDMNAIQPGQNFAPQKDWQDPAYIDFMMKKAAMGAPKVTTNVMPPREVFKDSMALKKDFDSQPEVKGFKEVQHAWDQIQTSLKVPSAANDLAAATKFMKLLDPGSVVRESELMLAMEATGKIDRMSNYHNLLLKGHKLTPQQRQDFYQSGEALYRAAEGRYGQAVKQYQDIGAQYGLDNQFIRGGDKKLQANKTAIMKAQDAIKRGADPAKVKQRLREQGYDDSGL